MRDDTSIVTKITMHQFRMNPELVTKILSKYLHDSGVMTDDEFELISKFGADIDFDSIGRIVLDFKEPLSRAVMSKE